VCTLTIYRGKKRCVVTMNRDERRTRKESGLLHSRTSNNNRLFYPVDVSSGGTWFGVNNQGVVLCLLNRYQAPQNASAVSRGEIIPAALAQGGFDDIKAWLGQMPHAPYNPFDLFLVCRNQCHHFSWDGSRYENSPLDFDHWFLFSSSGIMTEEVVAFRQNFFQAWSREVGKKLTDADEILRSFHLIQVEGMESHSPLMERELSHTKSIIQADLEGKALQLKYIPQVLEKSLDAPLAEAQIETVQVSKTIKR